MGYVGGTGHIVVVVPVSPQGHSVAGIAVSSGLVDFMDRSQRVNQAVQVLDFGSADCLVQIPAQHGAVRNHVVCQGRGRSIGHFGRNAVVLAFFTGQFLVVMINLILEPHEVLFTGDLVDLTDQASLDQVREFALVNDHDVAQIAFFSAGRVDFLAGNLRGDDVQDDVEAILHNLGKPALLDAMIVGRSVIDGDGDGFFALSHRADGYHAQKQSNRQQNRQKPFHSSTLLLL